MEDPGGGRRRHARVAAHLPLRLSTIDPETDPWTGKPFFRTAREWSGNVSRGGIFVLTDEPILPGQRVLVELALPGGDSIEAVGRVAWARRLMTAEGEPAEAGLGLQFIGASGEQMLLLESYVRTHAGAGSSGDA